MMIKYYDITENELNSKAFEAGSVYFCYDTLRIYYDSISDNKRIDISEFAVVLDTENERDGLLSPIPNKLYYIKENNKLYIYLNSEWFAINEPTTLAQLGITATATEINHLSGISSNVQEQFNTKAPKRIRVIVNGSSCDYTFDEIMECYSNGAIIELFSKPDPSCKYYRKYELVEVSDTEMTFICSTNIRLYGNTYNGLVVQTIKIDNTNTITKTSLGSQFYIPSTPINVANGGTGYDSMIDTTYTIARYRASALVSRETTPTQNGVINWVYE